MVKDWGKHSDSGKDSDWEIPKRWDLEKERQNSRDSGKARRWVIVKDFEMVTVKEIETEIPMH